MTKAKKYTLVLTEKQFNLVDAALNNYTDVMGNSSPDEAQVYQTSRKEEDATWKLITKMDKMRTKDENPGFDAFRQEGGEFGQ